MTSGSSRVQEFQEPRSIFNYVLQTCNTQDYDAAKQILGSGMGGSNNAGTCIYPFPFACFNRFANRGLRRQAPFPAGKLNIGSLVIDVITNTKSELTTATADQANLIDSVQLCYYTPVVDDEMRNSELQKAYQIQSVDYKTRINYDVDASSKDIDISYLSGVIKAIMFDARTSAQNSAKQYYKRNELKTCKIEIDGQEFHKIENSVEAKFEAFRDGVRQNADGHNTKVSFSYNPASASSNGSLNTAPISKLVANVSAPSDNYVVDVLAVMEATYSIRAGRLIKE